MDGYPSLSDARAAFDVELRRLTAVPSATAFSITAPLIDGRVAGEKVELLRRLIRLAVLTEPSEAV